VPPASTAKAGGTAWAIVRTTARVVSTALTILVLLTFATVAVASATGWWRVLPIRTGSMAPFAPKGAAVVVHRQPTSKIARGDVIVFNAPTNERPLVVHRVYSIHRVHGAAVIETKGDANDARDPWRFRIRSDQVWTVDHVLPSVGGALVALGQKDVRLGVLISGALIVLLLGLGTIWSLPQTRWREPELPPIRWRAPWAKRNVRRSVMQALRTAGVPLGVAVPSSVLLAALLFVGLPAFALFTAVPAPAAPVYATTSLAAPTSLTANGIGATVNLNWTATTSSNATGTAVLRGTASGGPYSEITRISGLGTTAYADTPGNGTFYYVVQAYYSANGANWTSGNSNEASATASTCPTTTPSGVSWINGFETGRIITGNAKSPFFSGANTANVTADSAVKRYGTYSLKINANNLATNAWSIAQANSNVGVMHFAVRLASLPSSDVQLAQIGPTSGNVLSFGYQAATQKLGIQFTGGAVGSASSTVIAGQWYVIDIKVDMTSTTLWSASWQLNGAAQTGATRSATAQGLAGYTYLGSTFAATYTANYDDVALSFTGADYPLRDAKVLLAKPSVMGTNNTPTNFQNNDNTAINANSYLRVDDIPMSASTDFVKQVTLSSSSYIEFGFENTAETCVSLVQGTLMYDPQNSSLAANGKTSIFSGATERVIYSGSMTGTTTTQYIISSMAAPPGTTWSPTLLNALLMRIGYSTDATPNPRWDALAIEYAAPL
jgi:signal peptidase